MQSPSATGLVPPSAVFLLDSFNTFPPRVLHMWTQMRQPLHFSSSIATLNLLAVAAHLETLNLR
jgi:hypothetical protein